MSDHQSDHHHHHDHDHGVALSHATRRTFLRRSAAVTFAAAVGITASGALVNTPEAWGLEPKGLSPDALKTLILVARDIYPHDKIPDRFYAIAVKPFDAKAGTDPAYKAMIEQGIAGLDAAAGPGGYVNLRWENERVALLRPIAASTMFETVRAGLVVSLYNQPEVWPLFGYQGESFSKGGYIHRGFDDIDWI